MSLESEARKHLEAQKRAAQEQERQRLAQQQAREARNRAQDREMERVKSEAILKFRGLNPERLLEEVRRAWHTGRIVPFSDPSYIRFSGSGGLDGVMLFQRGDVKHSRESYKGQYETIREENAMVSQGPWQPSHSIDTETSPVDIATISLAEEGVYPGNKYGIILEDMSGYHTVEKTTTKTGLFSREKSERGQYSSSFSLSRRLDLNSVTPHDIHTFFVETTARRMAGEGNLRIH